MLRPETRDWSLAVTALSLAPVLDTAAAVPLRQALLDLIASGDPITLDGSQVAQAGQACLQVLASAQAMAASIPTDFELNSPSEPLASMILERVLRWHSDMPLPELVERCPRADCTAAALLESGDDPRKNIFSMASGGDTCSLCGGYGWIFTKFGAQVFTRADEINKLSN